MLQFITDNKLFKRFHFAGLKNQVGSLPHSLRALLNALLLIKIRVQPESKGTSLEIKSNQKMSNNLLNAATCFKDIST